MSKPSQLEQANPACTSHASSVAQVIAVCKSADMLLMVLDAVKPHSHREILTRELESVGIRLSAEA